jgi:integrase
MTTYYLRGSIIWLSYYVDGKRIQKSTKLKNTPENIKVVTERMIPALDIKIATGEIYRKKPKTFEYYGEIFLKEKDGNKTYFQRKPYWERVIDHFRGRNVDTITRLEVKQYLTGLKMKTKSKNAYKSCVKEVLELAVDDGVISFNPALDIRLKPDQREEVQFYSREEVRSLLAASTGIMRAYLMLAFNTGMRAGEILGLQLGDFKNDGYIHIKRTRTKGTLGTGKTFNAIRKVPFPAFMLDEVKKVQPKNSMFIFGNFYDDSAKLRYLWRDVVEAAGVPKHKLYATRHTFATLMLKEKKVSINELAGLLGHSNPKITLEHYASVINSKNIDLGAEFSLFSMNEICDNPATVKNENVVEARK